MTERRTIAAAVGAPLLYVLREETDRLLTRCFIYVLIENVDRLLKRASNVLIKTDATVN
jgi:hypothetical protein